MSKVYSLASAKFVKNNMFASSSQSSSGTANNNASKEEDPLRYKKIVEETSRLASNAAVEELMRISNIDSMSTSEISVDTKTTVPTNEEEIYNLSLTAFYYALPFLKISNQFFQATLPESDPNYLPLNNFKALSSSGQALAGNFDFIYTAGILDLRSLKYSNGFYKMTLPKSIQLEDRYYIFQFYDLFTNNFKQISSKTNKGFVTEFNIVAPDYTGEISENTIVSPTWFFFILLRVYVNIRITGDQEKAEAFTKRCVLDAPSNEDPRNLPSPFQTYLDYTEKINTYDYYTKFAGIVQWQHVFTEEDQYYLNEFNKLGIFYNNQPFGQENFPFISTNLLANEETAMTGKDQFSSIPTTTVKTNFWYNPPIPPSIVNKYRDISTFIYNYSYPTAKSQGIYWIAYVDGTNNYLDGNNTYTVTFDYTPPVNSQGFWSLTSYNMDGETVPEPDQKYLSVGNGITQPCVITLSNKPPPYAEDPYYLQIPKVQIYLILRMYYTEEESYSYIPPFVVPKY